MPFEANLCLLLGAGFPCFASFLLLEAIMPTGVYKRTDYHKRKIKEADNSGRFVKGHKCLAGSEKGRFKTGDAKLDNAYAFSKGSKNPRWKNGKYKAKTGYIFILMPEHPFCDRRGYIMEHRLVIEQQIGRYLKLEEVTHHLGAKDDNRPYMLMAFINHSAHKRFERDSQYSEHEIIFDGRKLITKGEGKWETK